MKYVIFSTLITEVEMMIHATGQELHSLIEKTDNFMFCGIQQNKEWRDFQGEIHIACKGVWLGTHNQQSRWLSGQQSTELLV
jgi:hypothetical protein